MTVIEVAIGPGGAAGMFKVEVVASPAGEATATVELDADALLARRGLLQQAVLASAVPRRRVLSETEQPVREVGELLLACDEDWRRILSHLVRSGRSPVRGARLVVR